MIEHFPPMASSRIFTNEELQYHTRSVQAERLGFAQRAGAHYTALLMDRTIDMENKQHGDCFVLCVYDALVAVGIAPQRIRLNQSASEHYKDRIHLLIAPATPQQGKMCLYLQTSMRERWAGPDRSARIAKDIWGKKTRTLCLIYAEHGVKGFLEDCAHPKTVNEKMARLEACAYGMDVYAALSQSGKVNALILSLREDALAC